MSFNSNTTCLCPQKYNNSTNINSLLKSLSHENSIPHNNDPCDILNIKHNFKYYDNHEFHKLNMLSNNAKSNNFSIFHSNICSLQGNFDSLQILLNDLNHEFDITSLSETWNPESKKHVFSAPKLENYHSYKGTTGTTGNSGCGLYIHENLTSIPRPDLNFKSFDNEEEFESI